MTDIPLKLTLVYFFLSRKSLLLQSNFTSRDVILTFECVDEILKDAPLK